MKYVRKLLAVLSALCLLAALCLPAVAEPTPEANWNITPTLGTTNIPLQGNDVVSVLEYTPGESGIFRFTLTGGSNATLYTLYGSMFANFFHSVNPVAGNTYDLEVKESYANTPILIGVSGTGTAKLNIKRIGDAGFDVNALPYETYECTETLKKFDLPNDITLTYVDVTQPHTAVLGADGYYHLDTDNGPLLYVNLGANAPYASLGSAAANGAIKVVLYDEDGNFVKKIEFITCINQYFGYTNNTTGGYVPGYTDGGVYPLTNDFVYILQTYTQFSGWNDSTNPNYLFTDEVVDKDTAWMFCLGYDAEELPGGKKNPHKVYGDTQITLGAGKSAYFTVYSKDGLDMTVSGSGSFTVDSTAATGEHIETVDGDSVTYLLENGTAAEQTYQISFGVPVGTPENPEMLTQGGNYTAPVTDGEYVYQYISTVDGIVSVTVKNGAWYCTVNGTPVRNTPVSGPPAQMDVKVGDVVVITILGSGNISWTLDIHAHSYAPASCLTAATCSCGATQGEPLPHDYVTGEGVCNGVGLSDEEFCGDDIRIYLTETENTLYVPAGETVYYAGFYNGMNATFTGNNVTVVHNGNTYPVSGSVTFKAVGMMRYPCVFIVTNTGSEDGEYTLNFTYASGTMEAPELLNEAGDYTAPLAEETTSYFYSYTATADGTLTVTMTGSNWQYVINNKTKELFGETHWCDDDPLVPAESMEIEAGDVIEIMVAYYDPTYSTTTTPVDWKLDIHIHQWSEETCAADTTCSGCDRTKPAPAHDYQNGVCVVCGDDIRILLTETENTLTVPAGETLYYKGFFGGMLSTFTGENVTVAHNGEAHDVAGSVAFMTVGDTRNPSVYAVTNHSDSEATYTLSMEFPLGSSGNPEAMDGNSHTVAIEEGDEDGHYLRYTVAEDGKITIAIQSVAGWQFSVNNPDGNYYGDLHRSNDDEVVSEESFDVKKGDEVIIMVSTLDPDNQWTVPAGEVVVNITLTEKPAGDDQPDSPGTDTPNPDQPEDEPKLPSLGIDLDDDGAPEMLVTEDMLVEMEDGIGIDLNRDGVVDAMVIDLNRDGIFDGLDIDFDGVIDLQIMEMDATQPGGNAGNGNQNGGQSGGVTGSGNSPQTGEVAPVIACLSALFAAVLLVLSRKKATN